MLGLAKIYEIKKIRFIAVAPEADQQGLLGTLSEELTQIQALFEAGFHYFSD
jgi:hypothetical protein